MPKPDAAAELAAKMIQVLERLREAGGDAYPPTQAQLAAEADPAAPPEFVARALKKKPFAARLVVALKLPDAPVALAEDADRLADSPRLLEAALNALCTPEKRLHPPAKVLGKVDKVLKPAVEAALQRRLAEGSLPATVGVVEVKGKPQLYLQTLPPPAVELSRKLVQTLEWLRTQGPDAYPLAFWEWVHRAHLDTTPLAQLKTAMALPPFADQVLCAAPGEDAAPVALTADRDLLLASPLLLQYALDATTSRRKPLATIDRLTETVLADLRGPFAEALRRTAEAPPDFAGVLAGQDGPSFYLKALAAPGWVLARELIAALRARKEQGGDAYPATLDQLTAPPAPPERLREAVADKTFKTEAVRILGGDPAGPVALAEDAGLLAGSPATLEAALAAVRKPDNQAVPLADLKKKVAKPLQAAFEAAVIARIAAGRPSPGVGCLYVKQKPHLFLLRDLNVAPPPPDAAPVAPEVAAAPAVDFAAAFDEAFDRLDGQKGAHNLVSLADLRPAVPADRAAFDAGLHRLRREGRYTLSTAEGRHGVSDEERAAAVPEDGALLLFVSRKRESG